MLFEQFVIFNDSVWNQFSKLLIKWHLGSIPGLERSPGEGNGNPLQYSCLENPMDRGEPGGLQSMGSQRVGQDWATFTHSATIKWHTKWNFPGSPMVKTVLPLQGAWVWSLVGELRSHMLCGWPKKKGGHMEQGANGGRKKCHMSLGRAMCMIDRKRDDSLSKINETGNMEVVRLQ